VADPRAGLDVFEEAIMRVADVDFILEVDPRLHEFEWGPTLRSIDRQPFAIGILKERIDEREAAWVFRDAPTVGVGEEKPHPCWMWTIGR
jgi:hypothetical protein